MNLLSFLVLAGDSVAKYGDFVSTEISQVPHAGVLKLLQMARYSDSWLCLFDFRFDVEKMPLPYSILTYLLL